MVRTIIMKTSLIVPQRREKQALTQKGYDALNMSSVFLEVNVIQILHC